MTTCPSCNGPQMVDHPGGILEYIHEPAPECPLLAPEDATRAADLERHAERFPYGFTRGATETERLLLTAQGYETLPAELTTQVRHITPGVRRRTWDDLG